MTIDMSDKKKICIIASSPIGVVSFWRTNIEKISKHFDVYVVSNYDNEKVFEGLNICGCKSVAIERRPSIISILKSVRVLRTYFKEEKFDGFISMSSNASLISCIAGRLAGVGFRARIFTGQVWANKTGFTRSFFKCIDRFTIALNNHTLVDGLSQQEYLIANHVLKKGQSIVLANGSICGVDVDKFKPSMPIREKERKQLGFEPDDVVFTFMGRINRDKGVYELLEAFNRVAINKHTKLLLIGNNEGISDETFKAYPNIQLNDNLICYGLTKTPFYALQAGDVFCLPSYREGFGVSVIEAAAVGMPVIASDAYGLRDSFVDGVTGLKCKVRDADSLAEAMIDLSDSPDKRIAYGIAGRERVVNLFSKELVSNAWLDYLDKNLC